MEGTQENGYKFYCERFHLGIRNTFFTVGTIIHCNSLPRKLVE